MARQANQDELDRIANLEEAVRRLQLRQYGGVGGGGGGPSALSWTDLTTIWTPAAGTGHSPFGYQPSCRFAADANFFYLACRLLLGGPNTTGSIDTTNAPIYFLGSLASVASAPWLPATIAEDQTWTVPAAVSTNSIGERPLCLASFSLPVLSSSGTFYVELDGGSGTPSGTAIEIHAAVPWQPGRF